MCDEEILITEDGLCDKDNECQLDDCDFCTRGVNGDENCVKCEDDKVLKFNAENKAECISEESEETEGC